MAIYPLFLAPMAELSHRALRELIECFGGCDEYWTEMISAGALTSGGQFEQWYRDAGPRPEKTVFQLCGAKPEQLVKAAVLLNTLPCAGIDINMGCCAPAITRTGAGIQWMRDSERAAGLIAQVRAVVSCRLSVKIRLGFTEDFDCLLRFCKRLEAAGLDLITLHPRTAQEKLKRRARWDYVYQLASCMQVPVVGNGDIAEPNDCMRREAEGRCYALMIGRGAVRKPWFFAQLKGTAPLSVDLEETALLFLAFLARYQPEPFHYSRACRFFTLFCDNLRWAHYLKQLLYKERTLCGMEAVLRRYFYEHEEEKLWRLS
ncbi:MAG: tRNA-dihydrouridine synthase family protein [Spirochaetaceae bacterium]|nr:tRNA-dihydrouridine synthase family protein [Spirochaetaceae bacterium]